MNMNSYRFEEITVGQTESFSREITREMEDSFRALTGDMNPLHRDDGFAREIGNGRYPSHVCFGMLTASLLSSLAGMLLPGEYSLIHSIDSISFKKPVFVGDTLTVTGTVTEKVEDLRLILVSVRITNQAQKLVSGAKMKILVQK